MMLNCHTLSTTARRSLTAPSPPGCSSRLQCASWSTRRSVRRDALRADLLTPSSADNVDGKQARRTKSSSALGELFDHGCDSLFVTVRTLRPLLHSPPHPRSQAWPSPPPSAPRPGSASSCCTSATSPSTTLTGALAFPSPSPPDIICREEYHTGILILGPLANPTESTRPVSTSYVLSHAARC